MTRFDPLDAIENWPGDVVYHVARFNDAYLAVLTGILEPLKNTSYWEGTPELVATMPGKVCELIEMLNIVYECPESEGQMRNVVQVGLILPANTQYGAPLTFYQYNKCPFAAIIGDTTGLAELDETGGVIVPEGNWLASFDIRLSVASAVHVPIKFTHGGSDIIFSDIYCAYDTALSARHAVISDGETAIAAYVHPTGTYAYWGHSVVYDVARVVGTLTLEELPS